MTVLAENKRRVCAALIAVVVLLAVGFGAGRISHGTPVAQAAAVRAQTVATTVTTSASQSGSTTASSAKRTEGQLASAHRSEVRLRREATKRGKTTRRDQSRISRAQRCERDRRAMRLAHCLRAAVGRR